MRDHITRESDDDDKAIEELKRSDTEENECEWRDGV